MTTDTFRALCAELVDIITAHANPDDYAVGYVAETLARASAALAEEEPAVPAGYIDPEHSEDDRALLEVYYSACQAEGGTADEVTLRGLRAVLASRANDHSEGVRQSVREAIAEAIGDGAYDCFRVWEAWGEGTMGEDDFAPIVESDERIAEIADAAINAMRRAPVAGQSSYGGWQTGLPPSPGFYYVRDLLDESIGGDNRPVYVNPKHFVWGFWEQDDPEWIGLDSDITPENIQWKPVAPPLAPPADGEVAELAAWLEETGYLAMQADVQEGERYFRTAELLQRQATAYAICERERLHQSTRAADLEVERQAVPVAVSERMPEPGDYDDQGRCWWLVSHQSWPCLYLMKADSEIAAAVATHWLPAHALPIPHQQETNNG